MNIVDPGNTPEAALGEKDTGSVIRRCLAALSPEHAEMIDLVYYQEKSIKEIMEGVNYLTTSIFKFAADETGQQQGAPARAGPSMRSSEPIPERFWSRLRSWTLPRTAIC